MNSASSIHTKVSMAPQPNPKDSMRSTWRTEKKQWRFEHYFMNTFAIHPNFLNVDTPKHAKTDPVPYIPDWQFHRWILAHVALVLAVHQAYILITGRNLGYVGATIFYSIATKLTLLQELQILRHLGHIYGYLDGDKHPRDEVPDHSVQKTLLSLVYTTSFRPIMSVLLTYNPKLTPMDISWAWLPIHIGLYHIVLDFWFYWYHRSMHDVDWLWSYHRTHHLTKHPNPLLSAYADSEQEFFDIAVIPFLTWTTMRLVGMPMNFYDWFICQVYILFIEAFGHSGLRMYGNPPSTLSWLLRATGTELTIEDHDLHHRNGWRKSSNYGKQPRIWDVLFRTARDRVECLPENINYDNQVEIPLFSMPAIAQNPSQR